jgi:hypothetical protein
MSMSDVDKDGYDRSTEADRIRAQFERGLTRLYPVQYTSEAARTVENGEEVERMKSRVVVDASPDACANCGLPRKEHDGGAYGVCGEYVAPPEADAMASGALHAATAAWCEARFVLWAI